ncbi:MAG: hypothetical protein JSR85_03860 [Proteobacteria bacterium]|nr:hypothetical protein [Pseudomonadota bacterium]
MILTQKEISIFQSANARLDTYLHWITAFKIFFTGCKQLYIKRMIHLNKKNRGAILLKFFVLFFIFFNLPALSMQGDEIDFFNVGQGHAVLVNKVGRRPDQEPFTPLLIDAGCKAHPSKIGMRYEWTPQDHASLTSQISERILDIWKASNGGALWGKQFTLNVIITHPDEDHKDLVPSILTHLESRTHAAHTSFVPTFLLGGRPSLYSGFLERYQTRFVFSEQWPEVSFMGNLGFLDTSNCITHLFCPRGSAGETSTDRNRWSIIARVQINGMTALLPGDADDSVKDRMLISLGDRKSELETDILLAPHHGARGTYHPEWDHLVNPRTVIIGAALKHNHPKGSTLLDCLRLKEGKGRIWNDRVMAHGLQYNCNQAIQRDIEDSFLQREGRLFDKVPNDPLEAQLHQPTEQWYLAWVDVPIYTLWTTGSLRFEESLLAPRLLDTSHGLMGYIAVSDPQYLLSPYIRGKLTPLIPPEREFEEAIAQRVKVFHADQDGAEYCNMILKETLLIEDHQDRSHYLQALLRIFSEKRPVLYRRTSCFQSLREAIVERNKKVDHHEERVQDAVNFIFRNFDTLKEQGESDLSIELCDGAFDRNVNVLKTFLRSVHGIERLKQYVLLSFNIARCGPCANEMDDLCPFGFPEWMQLAKLVEFFRQEVITLTGESMSVGDLADIAVLRAQGKNFKQIAIHIIEEPAFIDWFQDCVRISNPTVTPLPTREEIREKLNLYFPRELDDFLS